MRIRFALLFALALFISLVGVRPASAQATANAQLNGTVTDPSGATVANAAISVRNTATNAKYTATSNASGFYAVTNLAPGTYQLTVSASGFANYQQTLTLTVAQFAAVDVNLQLASQGEKVVVTTETPLIEPTKTEISQVVGPQQVQSLPISGRVFTNFALLTPGVTTSRTSLGTVFTEFEVTQISFGGMRSFSNEITVDGADFVNAASGIQRATPPQASVEEFRVVNNSFGAEYGRAIGGIVNIVTKSGTNNFHGSIYEYLQNGAADARSLLATKATADTFALPNTLRENQFGVDVGGPIKKDKTFFFANYEGKRSAQSPLLASDLVANDALPDGNLELIDLAKQQMGLAPEGCFNTLTACGTNLTPQQAFSYLQGFTTNYNDDTGFVRIDQQVNANNRVAIRYNIQDVRASGELVGDPLDDNGIAVPSAGRNLFTRDQAVVATWSDLLSPDVANSMVAQYARRHYFFPGATGQPDLDLANDLQFGHNFGANDALYETRVELGDTISWVKGNHIVKFGFDGNWLKSFEDFPGFTPVRLIIPAGLPCLYAFSQYVATTPSPTLAGPAAGCPVAGTGAPGDTRPVDNGVIVAYAGVPVPTSPTFQAGLPLVLASNGTNLNTSTWANAYPPSLFNQYGKTIDHGYWGGFLQDQWRITPRLTINYGLRWDFESGLAEFVKPDYNEWQPRIGLAYSPDSKTVLRAGFGMFDDRYNLTFFFVPNTQKTVPGYLCGNHAPANVAAACAAAGVQPQNLSFTTHNNEMASQGYQLAGFAGASASSFGKSIITTGGYDGIDPVSHEVSLVGTCFMGDQYADMLPGNECGIGTGGMEYNSAFPYAEQASAEIDRQFGGGFALNVGYLFVGGHRLVRGNNVNVPCPLGTTDAAQAANPTDRLSVVPGDPALGEWVPGLLNANGSFSQCASGTPTLGTGALAGLGPFFQGALGSGLQTISAGLLDYNNDVANARYNGLTVTAIERLGNYFNLTANYTYSHTIDNGNFTTFVNLPVNQFNYRAEEANSNQDQRHLLVTNFTANSPTTGAWWRRDWLFSSIITLGSGRPFTIYYGSPTLNDFAAGSVDRVGGAGVPGTHCATVATCQTMIPRNTYIGDPLYSWDLRFGRSVQLRSNLRLDLAVDAFNVLNRPNVDQVYSIYGSPVFCGAIPGHYNDAVSREIQAGSAAVACPDGGTAQPTPIAAADPTSSGAFLFIPPTPTSTFGAPETMMNPRQFQFSAKVDF
ncbi:MAG: TonB-dependent receptor [Candidatus Acidiferrales bacterium]